MYLESIHFVFWACSVLFQAPITPLGGLRLVIRQLEWLMLQLFIYTLCDASFLQNGPELLNGEPESGTLITKLFLYPLLGPVNMLPLLLSVATGCF